MGKKVIVVDDAATVRQQVGMALKQAGYDVLEATDGQEGKNLIDKTPDAAMVICDVNMPRMNGLEMLEALGRSGRLATLPVIMLTTEGQPQLMQRAKAAGAKGWMVKPFKANLLVATVQKLTGS
jgi:two-component system chemotaxis response regulator CheY